MGSAVKNAMKDVAEVIKSVASDDKQLVVIAVVVITIVGILSGHVTKETINMVYAGLFGLAVGKNGNV